MEQEELDSRKEKVKSAASKEEKSSSSSKCGHFVAAERNQRCASSRCT